MRKLSTLNFELWFLNKNPALCAVACNASYTYEIIKETEKAMQVKIDSPERSKLKAEWIQWIPKSAVSNY